MGAGNGLQQLLIRFAAGRRRQYLKAVRRASGPWNLNGLVRRTFGTFGKTARSKFDVDAIFPNYGSLDLTKPDLPGSVSFVGRLSQRYPRIVFHLVTGYMDTLHRELSQRNVDLLIVRRFDPLADARLDFEFLFDETFVVAAGAQNHWARRRRIELADLANEPWVLPPPESVIGSITKAAFRASGLDYPRMGVVTDSPQVRVSLLATGRFVSIFPASALRFPAGRSEIKVLPVQLPTARLQNGIITLKDRTLGPAAQLFVDYARKVAKAAGE